MRSKRPTVLIAEDDTDLLTALEWRCKELGLDVIAVTDSISALNAATEQRPDVICMDVELPGGNGLAASEMFSSDERFSTIPLIIMTGRTDHEIENDVMSCRRITCPNLRIHGRDLSLYFGKS